MIASRILVTTVAFAVLSCSPCWAWQSGSRSAAPVGGSGSRVLAPSNTSSLGSVPQSFSSPSFSGAAPSISTPSFQPAAPEAYLGQPDIYGFQNSPPAQGQFAAPESVLQNGAPMSSIQGQFGSQVGSPMSSVQSQMPDAASSGSSAVGIPDSSLVDPVFEVSNPNSTVVIDHSAWDNFLSRYLVTDAVCVNRLRYRQVTPQDHCALKSYVKNLQSVDTRNLNRNEQLAYWFNLYNARTADLVLDHYPIRSIRRIKTKLTDFVGPFDDEGAVTVLGKPLSLNEIESGIVRPVWNDPRIHYALNCASFGCPNLSARAWTADDLDGRLNAAAYNYINSGRAVKRGLFGVRTSKIFKWYKDDFGGSDQAVLNHLRQYANADTQQQLNGVNTINGNFYDWSLNDGRILRRRLLEPVIR